MEYNAADCTPEKCGIHISPPAFLLIYKSDGKLRKKVMPLRHFKPNSNIQFIAHDLKKRHQLEGIPLVKIEKMLRLLQEILKGVEKSEAIEKVDKEFSIKMNEDLNKLSIQEIEVQKQLMDSIFTKNQIKRESPEFVYDKQVEFNNTEESNWDKDADSGEFWN